MGGILVVFSFSSSFNFPCVANGILLDGLEHTTTTSSGGAAKVYLLFVAATEIEPSMETS